MILFLRTLPKRSPVLQGLSAVGSSSASRISGMSSSSFYSGSSAKKAPFSVRTTPLMSPKTIRGNSSSNSSRSLFSQAAQGSASPVLAKKHSLLQLSPLRSPRSSNSNNNNNNNQAVVSLDLSLKPRPTLPAAPHEIGFPNFGNSRYFLAQLVPLFLKFKELEKKLFC